MELHYDITKQDFIDFNLNYYNNNAIVQRSIRTMRIATAHVLAAYAHAGFHRGLRCARCRLLLGHTALYAS